MKFTDLGLNPMILQALEEIGFETPTPVQSKTIPHLINSDKDLIGLAQTGTGKTAAFSLPIIQQMDTNNQSVQALILCPTRELAIQITKDIEKFIKYTNRASVTTVYGGARIDTQIRALKNNPQIVVGTPGRVNDMINRKILKVNAINWLVLDEADEMLNMGFKEELDEILKTTPGDKQVLLFSATMDRSIRRIANNYMKKPEEITIGSKNKGADNVEHFYYVVHERDRYQALRRIADANPKIRGIVFCRTRRETQKVADQLMADHYSAEAIHGEISQNQRTNTMDRFKKGKTQLLVATDVAARGIDVNELSHVINYNLPDSSEAYLHRSGRTGRAHNTGVSLVIVNMREKHRIRALENKIGKSFEQSKIPTGSDICEKQLFNLMDKICKVEIDEAQIEKYIEVINKKFEDLSKEEIIKKVVSTEFGRFIEHYKNAPDLNSNVGKNDSGRKSSTLFSRFKINIGKDEGLNIKELFNYLNSQKELKRADFGNIDIDRGFTLFEVDQNFKKEVMSVFQNAEIYNVKVKIECEATGIVSTRAPKERKSSGGYHNRSRSHQGGGRRRQNNNRRRY